MSIGFWHLPKYPGTMVSGRYSKTTTSGAGLRYYAITDVLPEDVLRGAKEFFEEHSTLSIRDEDSDSVTFAGSIGLARFSVDRHGGHTNVHVETDRVAGLDVTDLARRYLYKLRASQSRS